MRLTRTFDFLFVYLLAIPQIHSKPAKRTYGTHDYYVIEYNPTLLGSPSLDEVAQTLEVEVVERAGELRDYWLVRREKDPHVVSKRDEDFPHDPVLEIYQALQQQASGSDTNIYARSDAIRDARRFVGSVPYLERQSLRRRIKRTPQGPDSPLPSTPASTVAARLGIEDPLFIQQWHLVNDLSPGNMMNVTPVWDQGITGKGVLSSFLDDGLDYESVDLAANFDAANSYDFNDDEALPYPKLFDDYHGTRCAGQVAAVRNTACGVGIAYDSKVAGVRILSGSISDVDEASALNFGFQNVDIYSCSWGPADTGKSMEGPSYLSKKAFVNGITNGRGGKGSIFVFASGNGAMDGDQCNFDGYTNSIYTITVSAVDHRGLHPYYSEACAANMVSAYSSGSGRNIVTTDKGTNACSRAHGGTSAAAPNAVGVFALALEVRPDLTWRDIQHLCVASARVINPIDPDWEDIANGKRFNYNHGFGVLDASRFVEAARNWTLVKPQSWIESPTARLEEGAMTRSYVYSGGTLIGRGGVNSTIEITQDMLVENNFETLEHVNVKVWIDHTRRGDVGVELFSPNGIRSILAVPRELDSSRAGFPGWTFMSVKHWGENPIGNWTLRVSDLQSPLESGRFLGWNMIFWGGAIDASKTSTYEVPSRVEVLPTIAATQASPSATPGGRQNRPSSKGDKINALPPLIFVPILMILIY